MSRKTVAAILTEYRENSHADVIVTKLLEGYRLYGVSTEPRIEVVSIYLDLVPENDMGVAMAAKHGVPIFGTIAEAIGVGKPGVNVDGVLLIGEHGKYGRNELDQILYPRRRLFEAAISTMIAADTFVPIFNDKHLAWDHDDALFMYNTAKRFNVPFVAGSTLPIAWRQPALEYPLGVEGLTEALVVGYGPTEAYGYHALEALQAMVERRAGGETGVKSVQTLEGADVWAAAEAGRFSRDLLDAALATIEGTAGVDPVTAAPNPVAFLIEYLDGLRGSVILLNGMIETFGFAGRRNDEIDACLLHLQHGKPYNHFTFLIRQIESTILNGISPTPIERTLLAGGVTDFAMRSRHQGHVRLETPTLAISYAAPETTPDTGLGHELE
jgi:hypothetical protein